MALIGLAKEFQKTPAELIGVSDVYDAYCFNMACLYIINMVKQDMKPNFNVFKNEGKTYTRPSDLYKTYEGGGT